jgi:hypothetical protein
MRRALACLAALLAACGRDAEDPTSPNGRAPALGRYAYTLSSQLGGTVGIYRDAGTITLTQANADSISGTIRSDGANFGAGQSPNATALRPVGWNEDAFAVVALMPFGNYNLRLARGEGQNLTCNGRHLVNRGGTVESYPVSCTATYVGP